MIGLKISGKPADENHPYGHFRAETVASLTAALIMIAVGLSVLYNAARSIIFFKVQAPDLIAAATAVFCAATMYFAYSYNKKNANRVNSSGLMAAAKDNLSDTWVSMGTE